MPTSSDVAKFPTSKFVTTEIKTGGDKGATHTLVGNLSLHGVTKSITIPATLKVDGGVMTLKSEFALNKNDFGMTFSGGGGDPRRSRAQTRRQGREEGLKTSRRFPLRFDSLLRGTSFK